ncbi:hypothetical protein BJ508DRAFT_327414 [Ascobolus immersus RN42]|uniref:Uncharacterized protein n=1 Tax=Ascobolus immersus RN42 TaxID=1160509 RepID=A0A3N4I2T7_ASCIM|nr:hypothetical protein BJ508DRAFT_327414 [Ascobolus immersus RN42]
MIAPVHPYPSPETPTQSPANPQETARTTSNPTTTTLNLPGRAPTPRQSPKQQQQQTMNHHTTLLPSTSIASLLLTHLLTPLTIPASSLTPLTDPSTYTPTTLSRAESLALAPLTITPDDDLTLQANIEGLLSLARTDIAEATKHLNDFLDEPERDWNWLLAWSIKLQMLFWGIREVEMARGVLECLGREAEARLGVERWRVVLIRGVRVAMGWGPVEEGEWDIEA